MTVQYLRSTFPGHLEPATRLFSRNTVDWVLVTAESVKASLGRGNQTISYQWQPDGQLGRPICTCSGSL